MSDHGTGSGEPGYPPAPGSRNSKVRTRTIEAAARIYLYCLVAAGYILFVVWQQGLLPTAAAAATGLVLAIPQLVLSFLARRP